MRNAKLLDSDKKIISTQFPLDLYEFLGEKTLLSSINPLPGRVLRRLQEEVCPYSCPLQGVLLAHHSQKENKPVVGSLP
jgi:hypothetical protein